MARKEKEPLKEVMNIPVTASMKNEILETAESEERKPADMGRVLWREALEARKEKEMSEPEPAGK